MPEPRKTVAVDLDGVLADFSRGFVDIHTIGDPIPGAVEFTRRLSQFADVLIWTTRCNPEIGRGMGATLLRNIVRDWLDRHGFAYADIWTGPAKPIAAAFIDDRAVGCRPQDRTNQPEGFDVYLMAEAFARSLCKDTPPGCSLSHTTPVLDGVGFRALADAEEAAGSIAAGNSPEIPDGSPDDSTEALAERVCTLLDAAICDGSLMYADRLPPELSEALSNWRDAQ